MDTTSLDDLPGPGELSNAGSSEDVNEIVSGIQQAAQSGGLDLPSRDVPINTSSVTLDGQAQSDYIPEQKETYIETMETPETVLRESSVEQKQMDNLNHIYNELHIFILIAFVYFIFQLPVFLKTMMKYLPFCFSEDKNLNLQGTIIKSILFSGILYVLSKSIDFISNL